MSHAVRVFRTESAESDLDSIAGYYGALNPVATLAMLDAIAETEFLLVEHPQIGRPGRVPGTREAVVVGTPFILIYATSAETATILRVLDGRQQWPTPAAPD